MFSYLASRAIAVTAQRYPQNYSYIQLVWHNICGYPPSPPRFSFLSFMPFWIFAIVAPCNPMVEEISVYFPSRVHWSHKWIITHLGTFVSVGTSLLLMEYCTPLKTNTWTWLFPVKIFSSRGSFQLLFIVHVVICHALPSYQPCQPTEPPMKQIRASLRSPTKISIHNMTIQSFTSRSSGSPVLSPFLALGGETHPWLWHVENAFRVPCPSFFGLKQQ